MEDGAGPNEELTQKAREATSQLRGLGAEVEARGCMVPDGVVPTQLIEFLVGVGTRAGEATATAAHVVATVADAVQWAELARAREEAATLQGLGQTCVLN